MTPTPLHIWLSLERRRAAIEARWLPAVKKALKAQVLAVVGVLKESGIETAKSSLDSTVPIEGIARTLRTLYVRAGVYNAGATLSLVRGMEQKFAGFGFNEEWTKAILEFFQTNLLNKAVLPITETTKQIIREVLDEATKEGWGVDKTIYELQRQTGEINERRARVIVRTETVRAMNAGSLLGAEKGNLVMEKVWITAKDERVRGSHRALDGRHLDMTDVFPNGCSFPGDPAASAKETIMCRCTLGYVPKRGADGRLIRKPQGMRPMNDARQRVELSELVG